MKPETKTRANGFLLALVLFATVGAVTAPAQSVPLVGALGSASTQVPVGSSVVVAVAPGAGHFVLTELCSVGFGVELSGSSVGFIATVSGCVMFSPGFPLPPREKLMCTNTTNPGRVTTPAASPW